MFILILMLTVLIQTTQTLISHIVHYVVMKKKTSITFLILVICQKKNIWSTIIVNCPNQTTQTLNHGLARTSLDQ